MKRTALLVVVALVVGILIGRSISRPPSALPPVAAPQPYQRPAPHPEHARNVTPPGAVGPCEVTRVIDGDTVDVACSGDTARVRLLRIDTPERGEAGYRAAGDALEGMVAERGVHLVFEQPGVVERDRYGRVLAYLFLGRHNLNVEMVRQGWSPFWTKYGAGRFAHEFQGAEGEAQGGDAGWRDEDGDWEDEIWEDEDLGYYDDW